MSAGCVFDNTLAITTYYGDHIVKFLFNPCLIQYTQGVFSAAALLGLVWPVGYGG